MEQKNVYFKKFETIGKTKDEAKANSGLNLRVDATQSYKKWAENNVTSEENVKEWMKEFLKKKKFDMPNDGAYIVLQSAISDTRERPYQLEDIKYETKTHTPESWYVLRDMTGNEVGREKTKNAAKQAVREFITDYKENVNVYREWAPKEKNSLVLKGTYTPSKGTRPCKLLVFGYPTLD
ncbi:MAG: hypothetical protein VZS44_07470 [Bacilli bacterium]|nr:hypothetical protein [Bacilli bacterium]